MVKIDRVKNNRIRTKALTGRMREGMRGECTPCGDSMGREQVQPGGGSGRLKGALDGTDHLFGRRNVQVHPMPRLGMWPGEMGAGEVQSMSRVEGGRAIGQIADDGMPHRRGVPPDLVCASALKRPFHETRLAMHTPTAMAKATKISATHLALQTKRSEATVCVKATRHPSVVGLGNVVPMGLKVFPGAVRLGYQDGPAGAVIQAVYGGDGRTICRPVSSKVGCQGVGTFAMHGHAGGFQHHGVGVIFEENVTCRSHETKFTHKAHPWSVSTKVASRECDIQLSPYFARNLICSEFIR